MGLNGSNGLGTVGFGLSLDDNNFSKGLDNAQKKASAFSSAVDGIKTAGMGVGGVLKSALSPNVAPLLGQVQSVAADYKITTTGIEAFGVAADKVTSQSLSGLNMTQKELGKAKSQIAGIAYGLNMDVNTVTKSFKSLKQANIDVTKVGFKSFSEYSKFLEVTGVDGQKFATTLAKMRSQFHMSDDQIKDTVQSVAALGKRFNMGSEAIQGMTDTVGMLAEEGASLWAELGPEKTKRFLQGTQALSVAFMKAGHSAQEAQGLALGVGRAMIKGRVGVQQLYSGLAEDLPDGLQILTENLGSVDHAFSMLRDDPASFAQGLAKITKQIRDTAKSPQEAQERLARFGNQLSKTFGPQFQALMGGSLDDTVKSFKEVTAELNRPGGLADKNGVISKMSNNYRSGLTYTDLLARSIDQFRTKLKSLMGETDAQFLDRFNKSAGATEVQLKKLVDKGGPLGKATAMMVEFSNHGIGGVASKISSDFGPAVAILIQDFGPILSNLNNIRVAFAALFSPVTLITAAIAGLYFYFRDVGNGGSKFTKFIDSLPAKFAAVFESAIGLIKDINWSAVAKSMAKIGEIVWGGIVAGVVAVARAGDWLIDAFSNIKWEMAIRYISRGVEVIAEAALLAFVYVVKKLPGILLSMARLAYSAFVGIFDGLEKALTKAFPGAASIIHVVLIGIKTVAVAAIGVVIFSFGSMAEAAVADFAIIAANVAIAFGPLTLLAGAIYGIGKLFSWLSGASADGFKDIKDTTASTADFIHHNFDVIKNSVAIADAELSKFDMMKLSGVRGEIGKTMNEFAAAANQALESNNQLIIAQKELSIKELDVSTTDGIKQYKQLTAEVDRLREASEDASKTMVEANDKLAKSWGVDMDLARRMSDVVKGLGPQVVDSFKLSEEAASKWKDQMSAIQTGLANDYKNIGDKLNSGKITKQMADAARLDAEVSAGASRQMVEDAIKYENDLLTHSLSTFTLSVQQANAAVLSHATKFTADIKAIIPPSLPEELASKVTPSLTAIQAANARELDELKKQKGLTAEIMEKRAKEIESKYLAMAQPIKDAMKEINEKGWAGLSEGQKENASKLMDSLADGVSSQLPKVAKVVAATAKKSMTDAIDLDAPQMLLGKPKAEVTKDMIEIADSYHIFVKKIVDTNTSMLSSSKKSMDSMFEMQKNGWLTLANSIDGFAKTATFKLQAFWQTAISDTIVRSRDLARVIGSAVGELNSALNGTSTVDVNNTSAATGRANSQASARPSFDSLISHIDNPSWAAQTRLQMEEEHKDLIRRIDLLIQVTALGKGAENKIAGKTLLTEIDKENLVK